MDLGKYFIASTSIDETQGSARIIIEGHIPAPADYDNPVVELFRPIREKYRKEIFFAIIVSTKNEETVCTLYPSNKRGREISEFIAVALKTLKGDSTSGGILADYTRILNEYISDPEGLETYLKLAKSQRWSETDKATKSFISEHGFVMPSLKKKKKTKSQKKAEAAAYRAAHPEVLQKGTH